MNKKNMLRSTILVAVSIVSISSTGCVVHRERIRDDHPRIEDRHERHEEKREERHEEHHEDHRD